MLGSPAPQSVRKLAKRLDLNKYTVWRWRLAGLLPAEIIRAS